MDGCDGKKSFMGRSVPSSGDESPVPTAKQSEPGVAAAQLQPLRRTDKTLKPYTKQCQHAVKMFAYFRKLLPVVSLQVITRELCRQVQPHNIRFTQLYRITRLTGPLTF